jgi:ABC-type uncharacterized transport system substrate-binding protein
MKTGLGLKLALLAALGALASPAVAHPHVWVNAKAELIFAPDGQVTGVRHRWTFDEAYTAYVTQGLDKDGDGKLSSEELQGLADENAGSLSEFDYFTVLKARGRKQAFDTPREARMEMEKSQVALSFLLPLKKAVSASGSVAMEINDPSFFVYFSLSEGKASISLAGAPQGCVTTVAEPKPLDAAMQKILQDEGAIETFAAANITVEYANRAIVACP